MTNETDNRKYFNAAKQPTDNCAILNAKIQATDNRTSHGAALETKQCSRPKEPVPQPKEVYNSIAYIPPKKSDK